MICLFVSPHPTIDLLWYAKKNNHTIYELSGVALVNLQVERDKVTRCKDTNIGMYHLDNPPITVTIRVFG
jgi:hypothetical protein